MEEDSPYARPLKYMNAVIRGIEREENQPVCEETSDSLHIASNRIQDQNLSVKQMYLRYPGNAFQFYLCMTHSPIFNKLQEAAFPKHWGKRRKCW